MSTNDKDEPPVQEDPISRSSGVSGTSSSGGTPSGEGVGDTDVEPEAAQGVGERITESGEERSGQDAGEEGRKGASGRPYGQQPDEESGISE